MARFLSAEWFEALSRNGPGRPRPTAGALDLTGEGELVIQVVATGTPEGDVSYQLVLGEQARVVPPGGATVLVEPGRQPQPHRVKFTGSYATLAGIACGELSAYEALLSGRARISGDASLLAEGLAGFSGLDLVPADVRASTVF